MLLHPQSQEEEIMSEIQQFCRRHTAWSMLVSCINSVEDWSLVVHIVMKNPERGRLAVIDCFSNDVILTFTARGECYKAERISRKLSWMKFIYTYTPQSWLKSQMWYSLLRWVVLWI